MTKVYNRKTKEYITEIHQGEKPLNFLYKNCIGRFLLKLIFINKPFTKLAAKYYESKLSIKKADKFIKNNNIDITEYENVEYNSFNDIFTRKKKKELLNIKSNQNELISPAESKLQIYKATDNKVKIKNSLYDLEEIIQDKELVEEFKNGYILVFRLSVDNYHRYCHIDDGKVLKEKIINGKLHTVCSISKRYKIYKENQREYTLVEGNNLGKYIQMEIGAMIIGKIINNQEPPKKGQEKGYFAYGGSSIVVITKDNIKFDKDILNNSKKEIETKINYGEKIGLIIK